MTQTVGDLDPDRKVLKFATSHSVVHLPDAEACTVQDRGDIDGEVKRAAVMFDDTKICKNCQPDGDSELGKTGEAALPTSTEVSAGD